MTAPAGSLRRLAADVLEAVDAGMHSNRALADHLELHPTCPPRDRGLVTHLVYGVLRHRIRLDAHIDAAAHHPHKLGPRVRRLLRIGAFELLELGHPPHAAIAEAAAAARTLRGGAGLGRLVGGILASVAEHGPKVDASLDDGPLLDRLERRHSVPRWWAGRWVQSLAPDAALARAAAIGRAPPVELRVGPGVPVETVARELAAGRPGATVRPIEGVARGLALRGAGDVFYAPRATAGDVWVQSGPSQRVVEILAPAPGERVLDLCAGRGTKTRDLAARLGGRGRLVAADLDDRRLGALEDLADQGLLQAPDGGLAVLCHDATTPLPEDLRQAFDAVLVDAPCTGLGEAARHPEVRYRRRYEDLAACAARQRAILTQAASAVAAGGRLVYAVCSNEPEEGPGVVDAFLRDRPDFVATARVVMTPEDGWSAGFFAARLVRAR